MRRNFWGFYRNWFLIDLLHYLLSRSDFGFEFAEIFLIKNDSLTWRVGESPTSLTSRGVANLPTSREVADSLSWRVGF
jgi:hypothetical protein